MNNINQANNRIGLASETIPKVHLNLLSEWINTYPRLTQGDRTREFESIFSDYLNIKETTFVNSGSSANLLMATTNLYFKDLRNKKVAIPALSWATTVSPFIQLGYEPFLIDADPSNLGLNIDDLYQTIKQEDVATLILVHVLGHDSSIDKIVDICDEFDIRLLEDTCQSLGSVTHEKKLGSFGLASTFSFFYGHHISTIEGGCVCSDEYEFNQISKSIRAHGWARNVDEDFRMKLQLGKKISAFHDLYTFYFPGYNIRSTDLNAFLGILQMDILDDYCSSRFEVFNEYKRELKDFWSQESDTDMISSFAYATLVENPEEVWTYLNSKNIETRPLIAGSIGNQPFWINHHGSATHLKYSDQIHTYGIYLPVHANLKRSDIKRVCSEFKSVARPYQFH